MLVKAHHLITSSRLLQKSFVNAKIMKLAIVRTMCFASANLIVSGRPITSHFLNNQAKCHFDTYAKLTCKEVEVVVFVVFQLVPSKDWNKGVLLVHMHNAQLHRTALADF
jgi:hypothetical protein